MRLRRLICSGATAVGLTLTGCGGSQPSTKIVSAAAPSILTQPANQTVAVGPDGHLLSDGDGNGSFELPVAEGHNRNLGSDFGQLYHSCYYERPTMARNSAWWSATAVGSATSNAATLTVNAALPATTDMLTYHNDIARTGQNLTETTLTTSNVTSAKFGKMGFYPVDGLVDAEPLYASKRRRSGNGTHNVLIVATEHGSVYAFDADSGATIWQVSTLGSGETTSDDHGCGQVTPEIGVTSTPVIDRTQGPNGAVYVVAMSKDGSGNYHQRLHALDLALGTELFSGPVEIQATYPGTGDNSSNGTVWSSIRGNTKSAPRCCCSMA